MTNLKPLQCLNLDKSQQKAFMEFYSSLGEKPSTTIRIFERSEYYSCHGEDALLVAKLVFKSTNSVKIMSSECIELPYISLSKSNFEALIRDLLLVRNYRVEVYTKSKQKKSSNEWQVEFKGSPGNLAHFEDVLFSDTNAMVNGSALVAVQVRHEARARSIGLGYIEANEWTMAVVEFVVDDFYSELEALIVTLSPRECLLPTVGGEYEKIEQVLKRNNVIVTVRKKNEFLKNATEIKDNLDKLIRFREGQQQNANTVPAMSNTFALMSLGAAINYLDLLQETGNHGKFQLNVLDCRRYVHLDAAAVSALNLFPKPGTLINCRTYRWRSVLGVVDRCRTPQGHRLVAQWIRQPLRDHAIINDRHDIVECFVKDSALRTELYDNHLKKLPDIQLILKRLIRRKSSLQDIFRLYQVTLRMPKILNLLANGDTLNSPAIMKIIYEPLKDTIGDLKLFKSMVEQIIDLEAIERGEYLVKATFDKRLEEKKLEMDNLESKMKRQLSAVASDIGLEAGSSIKLEFVSHLGFHFRITLKDETAIRKNSRYRVLDTVKGGVRFTNSQLTDTNSQFCELKKEYEDQQQIIVSEVIRVAIGYAEPWSILNNQIAQLDCLVGFAVAAVSAPLPYVRPKMHHQGSPTVLKLTQIRHPCLELQEDVNFIPNDAIFDSETANMHIITGPNMGGKSTYIRSVGVAVLMAHIGAFVACDDAEMSIMDSILGRVGADDNLSKGLSTFMVEMIETASIVRSATPKSLVIIDELGRGTSTYEGCGIAWSIAEWLGRESKCFTLFATHFQEITDMANYLPNVRNSHMNAIVDNKRLTLLYQVKEGIMQKSFGIQVAKLANFPSVVVELAQQMYDECEDQWSNLEQNNDEKGLTILQKCYDEIIKFDAKQPQKLTPGLLKELQSLLGH
ncbi:DNA mismatch repair protein spellchecker 1 [Anopheles aquasalis]|uniref:DNA mismatch repair protein spellchecker 1 n=1 Tax=Anopheles aquasalis TaxID=42839 RepID=UPI00215B2E5C|nr:DNA mismatch repair protein spellchecker 1 [Anopheles aquasalis]